MGLVWTEHTLRDTLDALLVTSGVYLGSFALGFLEDGCHSYYCKSTLQ